MLQNVVNKTREAGFTSVELAITLIVVGVLAAISIPSFLGQYNNYKLAQNLGDVRTALQQAQLNAQREGKKTGCTLNFDTSTGQITSSTSGCLTSGTLTLPQEVAMKAEKSPGVSLDSLSFSFRGTSNEEGTIVLYRTDGSGEKRCLAITLVTGIIRTGIYDDSATPPSNIDKSKCKPEKQV